MNFVICIVFAFLLIACGGGESPGAFNSNSNGSQSGTNNSQAPGTEGSAEPPAPTSSVPVIAPPTLKNATLTGAVVKGPVSGSSVCAFALITAGKGRSLGCTTTNLDGSYQLSVDFEGDVIVEASSGTYLDEATNVITSLSVPMQSVGSVQRDAVAVVVVTPLTLMAYRNSFFGGLSKENFFLAGSNLRYIFDLDPMLDLAATLPIVSSGLENAYGSALRTLSEAMANGATLSGIADRAQFTVTVAGLRRSNWCRSGLDGHLKDWDVLLEGAIQNGQPENHQPLVIEVFHPTPAWRASLPRRCPVHS